jgi:hypothetical protein
MDSICNMVSKCVSVLNWLPRYQNEWLHFNVDKRLTNAAWVIPMAMAVATITGLPMQTSLYVAFLSMHVNALLVCSSLLKITSSAMIAMLPARQLVLILPWHSAEVMRRWQSMGRNGQSNGMFGDDIRTGRIKSDNCSCRGNEG